MPANATHQALPHVTLEYATRRLLEITMNCSEGMFTQTSETYDNKTIYSIYIHAYIYLYILYEYIYIYIHIYVDSNN